MVNSNIEQNLLINGGFEDTSLKPWQKTVNVSLWPFDPHSGQAALILGVNALADATLSQIVNLPAPVSTPKHATVFRLNFYALGSLIPPAVFSVFLYLYNARGRIFRRFQLLFPRDAELNPAEYQKYTLETSPISPGSNLRRIEVKFSKLEGEGTVLLDDLVLFQEKI